MKNAFGLILHLLLAILAHTSSCSEIDISKIIDYTRGSTKISVQRANGVKNLYTHKFPEPLFLKGLFIRRGRLYFDPLLTSDQLLLSCSVLWVRRRPAVIQLNLEHSSVVLLNQNNSFLTVETIISEKSISNISHRTHSDTDERVDVNFLKTQDYVSNNLEVPVTSLRLPEGRFKRYTLRNYYLQSTRAGRLLFNDEELKTVVKRDLVLVKSAEETFTIPAQASVYSIHAYSYNNFPLLLEVMYTFNERKFFAYSPERKWHALALPSYNDPAFSDRLYKTLNYYACKNGFKLTVDIGLNSNENGRTYNINNYCIGPEGVETVVNSLKLPFYADSSYKDGKYRCYDHIPVSATKFFVDHLMDGSSVLQLPDTPVYTDHVRVYHHMDFKPYLIVFVDHANSLHYYVYSDKVWKKDTTVPNANLNDRFNTDIRALLDKLVADDIKGGNVSIAILTHFKTPYSNTQVKASAGNNLSSGYLLDNSIGVSDQTSASGQCLTAGGYKLIKHDVSTPATAATANAHIANLNLSFYIGSSRIELFEHPNSADQPTTLIHKKGTNDLYVYFYGETDSRPLLLCYNGKAYAPNDLSSYHSKWFHVKTINQCGCSSNNEKLLEILFGVTEFLNHVNINRTSVGPYSDQNVKGQSVNVSLEYTPPTSTFCYGKYTYKAQKGYTLGIITHAGHCIKAGASASEAKCVSATISNNPHTFSSELVTFYCKDDTDFSLPLIVAFKNGDNYQPYYTLSSNADPNKLYQKVDEPINLTASSDLNTKLNELRFGLTKSLQLLLGHRKLDSATSLYQAKVFDNAVAGNTPLEGTREVTVSEPVILPQRDQNAVFKYYQHQFSDANWLKDIGGLRLFLFDNERHRKEIKLYSDINGQNVIERLPYNSCLGNVYVYFYEDRDIRPLLLCYAGKAYRPLFTHAYDAKWVPVETLTKCPTEHGENPKLLQELNRVLRFLNIIKLNRNKGPGQDYAACKLFKVYRHTPTYSKAGDIEVCKDDVCQDKLTLNDADYKNHLVTYEDVYYNRYDNHFIHPLLLVLHYEGDDTQSPKRYYRFVSLRNDRGKTKNVADLDVYTNESDLSPLLVPDCDTLLNSITYQIDKKDNSYNSARLTVENTTNNSNRVRDNGFIRYTHTPKDKVAKRSFVLHKNDIITWWDRNKKRAGPINDVQNMQFNFVVVYFSPQLDEILMAGFFHKNNKIEYFFQQWYGEGGLHWQVLDPTSYKTLIGLHANKDQIPSEIVLNDCELLVKVLHKINFAILHTVVLMLEKKANYSASDVENAMKKSEPPIVHTPNPTPVQPSTMTVAAESCEHLTASGYSCVSHTISYPAYVERSQLRFLVPKPNAPGKYTEALLYNSAKRERELLYYTKASSTNKLYAYFYASTAAGKDGSKPLQICYDGKAYRPSNLTNDYGSWVRVDDVTGCACGEAENEQKLAASLNTLAQA